MVSLTRGPVREILFVAAFLVATSLVWASFIIVIGGYPLPSDQAEYSLAGQRLAAGFGLTDRRGMPYVHTHPPFYPIFLGAVYALGGGEAAVRWVQLALALLTLILVSVTARRVFGAGVARATLLAGGAYLPTAFYVTLLLSEVLFTFFLVLGVYLLLAGSERDRRGGWLNLVAGVTFGVAGLTRGVALVAAFAIAVLILARGGIPGRRRWVLAAAFAVGVAAAVLPWGAYVYGKTGRVVLVDTKSARILHRGNNPGTPLHHAWDIVDGTAEYVVPPEVVGAGNVYYRSRVLAAAALDYMAAHPLQTFLRFGSKFADMWEVERLFVGCWRQGLLPNASAPWVYIFIVAEVAASVAALMVFWASVILMPKSLWRRLTLAVVLCTSFAYAITIAHPRYNYPLMVLGAPALGYFFAEVVPRFRLGAYSRRRLALAAGAVAVLLLIWARMVWLYVTRGS